MSHRDSRIFIKRQGKYKYFVLIMCVFGRLMFVVHGFERLVFVLRSRRRLDRCIEKEA